MAAFWDKIFRRARREDPVFGSMLCMRDYWEGQAVFTPTGATIEIFVAGGPETDMELQHRAFQQIMELWPALKGQFAAKLQEAWQERYPDDETSSAWDHFKVGSVSVPEGPLEESEWDIDFATERDEHLFSFDMEGSRIVAFSMNG